MESSDTEDTVAIVDSIVESVLSEVLEREETKDDMEQSAVHIEHNFPTSSSYKCQICREENPPCGPIALPCSHVFCKECIIGYISSKVLDGCVIPKCCYVEENNSESGEIMDKIEICNADISPALISALLEDNISVLEKYRRFKYIKDNKNARQCPHCPAFIIGKPEETPRMNCTNCHREFCYFHSNAHDFNKFDTCELYEASIAEEQKESVLYLQQNSKPCPGCSLPVMKSGGCNHMKCQCGVAFCWLCGKQVDDSLFPSHFQWWNPSSCSNLQLDDAIEPTVCRRLCARIVGLMQLIILGPITLVSTLASSLLCCSCIYLKLKSDPTLSLVCGRNNMFSNCMSSWGMVWSFLLIIIPVFLGLGSVLVCVIGAAVIITYPCYAFIRISRNEYPWPDSLTRFTGRLYRYCGRCFASCGCDCCLATRQATYAASCMEERVSEELAVEADMVRDVFRHQSEDIETGIILREAERRPSQSSVTDETMSDFIRRNAKKDPLSEENVKLTQERDQAPKDLFTLFNRVDDNYMSAELVENKKHHTGYEGDLCQAVECAPTSACSNKTEPFDESTSSGVSTVV